MTCINDADVLSFIHKELGWDLRSISRLTEAEVTLILTLILKHKEAEDRLGNPLADESPKEPPLD